MADGWLLAALSHPEGDRERLLALAQRWALPVTLAESDHLYRLQAQAAAAVGVFLPAPDQADPTARLILKVVVFDGEMARANRNTVFFNEHAVWLLFEDKLTTDPETGDKFYLLTGYPATPSTPSGEAP